MPIRRWPKNQSSGLGVSKRVRLRMPTSVAATVTRASSPAPRPVILMGTVSMPPDFSFSGTSRLTPRVRAAWSMASQRRPMARLGMRLAFSSMGR